MGSDLFQLKWRPREENTEADDLTNEEFKAFSPDDRVQLKFQDLDLSLVNALVGARSEFEERKRKAKAASRSGQRVGRKRVDKIPW